MKRILFSALGAVALLVTGCSKDDLGTTMGSGDMTNVSISVAMGDASGTRATANYGTGSTVNRVILEIYASDGLYKRMVAEPTSMAAQFDLRLVTSQEYQFVAWADYSNATDVTDLDTDTDYYYDTNSAEGLKAITADYTSYLGSDEMRDAFFGETFETVSAATSIDMTLTRPFGQLNLFTDLTDVKNSMCPQGVRIMYSSNVANKFDASTGETSGSKTITWASTPVDVIEANSSILNAKDVHLATDYILAPSTGEQLVNFNVAFFDGTDTKITNNDNFANIPIKRNYRTNVSGELLTVDGAIEVTCDPGFLGELDVVESGKLYADDIAKVNEYLTYNLSGDVTIYITDLAAGAQEITIPDDSESTSITFVAESIDAATELTISSELYAGDVKIETPIETQFTKLVAYLPAAHVTFHGNVLKADVTTSLTTFVVLAGSTIGELNVLDGSLKVEANSTVTKITVDAGIDNDATIEVYGDVEEFTSDNDSITFTSNVQNVTTKEYYANIQAAIDAASDNDVIALSENTYSLTSSIEYGSSSAYQALVNIDKPITIQAAEGASPENVILDANNQRLGTYGAVIYIAASDVVLDGLTIITNSSGGLAYYSSEGGSRLGYGGSNYTILRDKGYGKLTVSDCSFPTNLVGDGGHISVYNHKDEVKFSGCTFEHTGIAIDSGQNDFPAIFDDCTFNSMKYTSAYNYSLKLYAPQVTYNNCAFNFEVDGITYRDGYEDKAIDSGLYVYVPFRADGDSKVMSFNSCTMNGSEIGDDIAGYIYGTPTINISGRTFEVGSVSEISSVLDSAASSGDTNPTLAIPDLSNGTSITISDEYDGSFESITVDIQDISTAATTTVLKVTSDTPEIIINVNSTAYKVLQVNVPAGTTAYFSSTSKVYTLSNSGEGTLVIESGATITNLYQLSDVGTIKIQAGANISNVSASKNGPIEYL